MKSKALKCFILASTLAFFNCGDATDSLTDAANSIQAGVDNSQGGEGSGVPGDVTSSASVNPESSTGAMPGSSGSTQPLSNNSGEVIASSAVDGGVTPTSSANALPTSSNAVVPASSTNTVPGSSAQVTPASSETATPQSSSSEEVKPAGIFLAEGKEEERDQMKVVYKTRTGWDGEGILAYPEQLSSDKKHAIVVWGPGGGEKPDAYEGMIRRLASHGFVVIALKESPGDASQATKALDWLEQQNKDSKSPLNGKLDMNTVGCSGHSMGGLESEQAAIKDKRVITAFLNNSGDRNGGAFKNIPATKTAGVVFGEKGMEHDNAISDYRSATSVPACMIEMTGGPMNSEGGYGHGSGPWDGMAITIAWMRWHLGGEDFRKADFVGSSGKYINGNIIGKQGKWKGECKNFN